MAGRPDLTTTGVTYPLAVTDSDDPETIRRQIDHTRDRLAMTIDAIGERLSPENLIAQAKTTAKEATVGRIKDMTHEANRRMEGTANSLGQTLRDNPLPVAVIGLGLGWLWLSEKSKREAYEMGREDYRRYRGRPVDYRRGGPGYAYYDDAYAEDDGFMDEARERLGDAAEGVERAARRARRRVAGAAHEAGEAVSDTAQRVGETVDEAAQRVGETVEEAAQRVSNTAQRVGETVSETTGRVKESAAETAARARQEAERLRREAQWRSQVAMNRTKQTFWESMEENPLAVGAVLAIAGAAVGAAIPTTEYENKLMGETRDRLMDEAKVRAQDAVERVQTVVEETQRAAVSEAKDAARRQNLPLDDMIEGETGV